MTAPRANDVGAFGQALHSYSMLTVYLSLSGCESRWNNYETIFPLNCQSLLIVKIVLHELILTLNQTRSHGITDKISSFGQ